LSQLNRQTIGTAARRSPRVQTGCTADLTCYSEPESGKGQKLSDLFWQVPMENSQIGRKLVVRLELLYGYLQKAHAVGPLNIGLMWAFMSIFYVFGYFIAARHYRLKGLRLADNRTHEEATWDDALLGQELFELKALRLPRRNWSDVLQIQLTANGSAPTSLQEQFVDQGEHVYGIWEYPFTGNLDNRGADQDFNGIQDMADEGHTNARAPFYLTSLKYGVYVQTTAFGHYNIAVNGVTQWFFDSPSLTYDVIYGPTYQQILSRYNAMAGPPVFPPLWALDSIWWRDDDHVGFHGMVMNAQENVLDATQLQNNQIRAGSLWIDRPYGTGVSGWGNMDFDSSFPDPLQMVGQLHTQGYQLMLWIFPLSTHI
jgi:hypothetical protein